MIQPTTCPPVPLKVAVVPSLNFRLRQSQRFIAAATQAIGTRTRLATIASRIQPSSCTAVPPSSSWTFASGGRFCAQRGQRLALSALSEPQPGQNILLPPGSVVLGLPFWDPIG